jgi:hypothetical protein
MVPKEFQYCCEPEVRYKIQRFTHQLLEHDCVSTICLI